MRSIRRAGLTALLLLLPLVVSQTALAECASFAARMTPRTAGLDLEAKTTVWTGNTVGVMHQEADGNLWLTRFDERGEMLDRETKVPGSVGARFLDLVWNGSEYGVFFASSDDKLKFARMTSDGQAIVPIHSPLPKVVIADEDEFDVVWDAGRGTYVVARTLNAGEAPTVWITFLRTDGSVRTDEKITEAAPGSIVRAAALESGVVGIFFERSTGAQLSYLRLSGSERRLYRNVGDVEDHLVVVARNNQFTLARWIDVNDRRRALVWTVLDTSGNQVIRQTEVFQVDKGDLTDPPLAMAAGDGDEYGIAYVNPTGRGTSGPAGFRLRRVDSNTRQIADTYFAAADTRFVDAATRGDIVWTGTSWITEGTRPVATGHASYLMRVCPLVAKIEAPRVVSIGEPASFDALVDGGVPSYRYQWQFADDVLSTSSNLQRMFTVAGDYLVTLAITDSTNTTATDSFIITVNDADPGAPAKRRAVRR